MFQVPSLGGLDNALRHSLQFPAIVRVERLQRLTVPSEANDLVCTSEDLFLSQVDLLEETLEELPFVPIGNSAVALLEYKRNRSAVHCVKNNYLCKMYC